MKLSHSRPSRTPDFNNLLKVLNRQKPERPTLFEFFLNDSLYQQLAGYQIREDASRRERTQFLIAAFQAAGYDYTTLYAGDLHFPSGEQHAKSSVSMNEGAVIRDRASFEAYPWPDLYPQNYSHLDTARLDLPAGMKLIVPGPGGVLENVMRLVGYEATCYLTLDDPKLAADIFAAVGSRLVRHYELAAKYETVGALISNDDWGFKSQPMLSPDGMREFVFPWHRKIVRAIHDAGKPAILHSCGNLETVMDDIIDDLQYDGKHSYEDNILPVEQVYDRYHQRIAIMGGIDLDFIVRAEPDAIRQRSEAMLERSLSGGAYALGTGNSVPEYVPPSHYFAMIRAATGFDYPAVQTS